MVLTYLLFVLGFVVLIKGADLLVDGAAALARRLRIPDMAIGLTVVAFGTSLPELFVNIIASVEGNPDIAIGNILGSTIANILLILGIASVIYPLSVQRTTIWREIPFSVLAIIVLALMANDIVIDGAAANILTRSDGLTLLCFFAMFLYYIVTIVRSGAKSGEEVADTSLGPLRAVIYIFAGLAGLAFGGQWIVNGAIAVGTALGISQKIIGLTVIAVGTSLPELAASAMAAYKRNADIAVGNVVGSNIFNIFWILGASSIISPLPFTASANIDIGVAAAASLLLFFLVFVNREHVLRRPAGVVFLLLYACYVTWTVAMA